MSDPHPRWPPEWLDDHPLATEETIAQGGDVELISGLRKDGHVLMAVSWPEGRRYMLIDPIGNDAPRALRAGETSEDPEVALVVESVWSQALQLAKTIIDGDAQPPAGGEPPGRRRWRRGEG